MTLKRIALAVLACTVPIALAAGYALGRGAPLRESPGLGDDRKEPAVDPSHRPGTRRNVLPSTVSPSSAPIDEEVPAESPKEARDREVEALAASGPGPLGLVDAAREVGKDWAEALHKKKLDVTFDEWHCHRAGCYADARHGASTDVDRATEEISRAEGFFRWNGGKMRTGPVRREDGATDVTWVLFSPPPGEPAFQQDSEPHSQHENVELDTKGNDR
jgi:hypothetical protein